MLRALLTILLIAAGSLGTASAQSAPPAIFVATRYCVGIDDARFVVTPRAENWDAPMPTASPGEQEPALPRPPASQQVDLARCREATPQDAPLTFRLLNIQAAESTEPDEAHSVNTAVFEDYESGMYDLEVSDGREPIVSDSFAYDAKLSPVLNITVMMPVAGIEPPVPAAAPLGITIYPHVCDGLNVEYHQISHIPEPSGSKGDPGIAPGLIANQADGLVEPNVRNCERAAQGEFVFALVPTTAGVVPPLYWTPDGRIVSDPLPGGDYELFEFTTGTSTGPIQLEAGADIVFLAPGEFGE